MNQYGVALVGLVGVALGALLGFLRDWVLRRREFDLRVWDKMLERRLEAHEKLISIATELHTMAAIGFDSDGELQRAPAVMQDRDDFSDWVDSTITTVASAAPWLTTESLRETYYLQDYLTTLDQNTKELTSVQFFVFGVLLRKDFIGLSGLLERAAHQFLERDIHKLALRDPGDWHKHPVEETERRLAESEMTRNWSRLNDIVQSADGG